MESVPDKWVINPNLTSSDFGLDKLECDACPARILAFCNELDHDELAELDTISADVLLKAPQALVYEGDDARYAYNLRQGVLRLSKMLPDGRRQITGFAFPGDFIGLADSEGHSATVEAIVESKLCRFDKPRLHEMCERWPHLERRFREMTAQELSSAQQQMLLLGRKTARERVSTFLYQMSQEARRRGASSSPIDLPMSRTDIADYLGLTIETVSRTISRLADEGVIKLDRPNRIEIVTPDALATDD
jgi:CRP/FNR family transcriptional regulator